MRQAKAQWVGLFLAALVCWGPFGPGRADEPVPTTLKVTGGTGNWLIASNWSHGVPNSPGAIAIIGGSTNPPVHVTAPVTIGELRLLAPGTQFIGGIGPLTFDNPGDAPAVIRTIVPRNPAVTTSISTPIDIAAGETLLIDVTQPNSLHLQGSIIAATGTIEKHGDGPLVLSGSNSAWGGDLIIREGLVDVAYQDSLTNPMGQVVLEPGTTLRLQANMLTPLVIDGADLLVAGSRTLAGPIELRGTATLRGEGGASQPIRLTGPISGEGGWHIGDETQGLRNKTIELSGDNTYLGETVLGFETDVTIRLLSPTGLGDPSGGTVVHERSTLALETISEEPIEVRGGRVILRTEAQLWSTPIKMDGGVLQFQPTDTSSHVPVILTGGENTVSANRVNWTGNVQGTGSLRLTGAFEMTGEMSHDGSVTLWRETTTWNRGNSYSGTTHIDAGSVDVYHPEAFGTTTAPIIIKGEFTASTSYANVTFHETVAKDMTIDGGYVYFRDAADPYVNAITLKRGAVSFEALPMMGEIILANRDLEGIAVLSEGTYSGTISGDGRLQVSGGTISGDNTYRGFTHFRSGVVDSSTALGSPQEGTIFKEHGSWSHHNFSDLMVAVAEPLGVSDGGILRLHVQQERLPILLDNRVSEARMEIHTPSLYDQRAEVRFGTLQAHAPVTIGELILHEGGIVEAETGGSVNLINPHVTMTGGTLTGPIGNLASVTKMHAGAAEIRDMTGFDGAVTVAEGSLALHNVTGSGAVTLSGRRARLDGGSTDLRVDVSEASGNFLSPVLKSITLSGDVHLGAEGVLAESVQFRGRVTGGRLVAKGVSITSDQMEYTGPTIVRRGGGLTLEGRGKLSATSEIIIHGDLLRVLNRTLEYMGEPGYTEPDRLGDQIPLVFQGGELFFAGPVLEGVTERTGPLVLENGFNRIGTRTYDEVAISSLQAASIERSPGAVLEVELGNTVRLLVDAPPPLVHGLIGGWATVKHVTGGRNVVSFASVDAGRVVPYTAHHVDIATATPQSNVLLTSSTVLPIGVTSVNSLMMRTSSGFNIALDLNGQRLAIESGGIMGDTISNGEITSGSGSNELTFVGSYTTLDASIVDSAQGTTSVTTSVGLDMNVANSFSGPMTINSPGYVRLDHFDALPDGVDLVVNDGTASFGYSSNEVKSLGRLVLRDRGKVSRSGNTAFVEFESIELESGTIDRLSLAGDIQIEKRTSGTATISNQPHQLPLGMPREGSIDVYEGNLVFGDPDTVSAFRNVQTTVHGGRLTTDAFISSSMTASRIALAGGELNVIGTLGGTIDVQEASTIVGGNGASNSLGRMQSLSGEESLEIAGFLQLEGASPEFSGDVTISGRVELSTATALGTGSITVTSGGSLGVRGEESFLNEIVLDGGDLNKQGLGTTTDMPFLGEIHVSSDATISLNEWANMTIAGKLVIDDQTRLSTRRAGRVAIVGDLLVGNGTLLDIQAGYLQQAGSQVDIINQTHLTGRIVSNATDSSLDISRSGFDQFVLNPSLHAHQGQTLSIRQEGELLPIAIDGPDKVVSGNGTIANSLALSGGATIAPGASPGVLTIDGDVSLGPGSKLAIEVGGTTPGVDYDSLIVAGNLDLSGAILELQFVNDFVPEVGQTFELLQAGSLTGMIANATSLYRTAEHAFLASYENGAVRLEATSLPAIAYGDFNSDGLVDAADYVVWRNALGDTGYDLAADANADAVVNGADYAIWKSHFGSQIPAGAIAAPTSVPEPRTGLLALGTLAMLSGVSWSRSRHKCC